MSSNLLKSNWVVVNSEKIRIIDSNALIKEKLERQASRLNKRTGQDETDSGFSSGLAADHLDALFLPEGEEMVIKAEDSEEYNRLQSEIEASREELASVEAQIQAMQITAREEAETLRTAAYEEAKANGYREGYDRGVQETETAKAEYRDKQKQLEQEYKQKIEDLEPKFIDALTGIYEHIFKVDLISYQNLVANLLTETLLQIETTKNYLIHVSKDDFDSVNGQKEKILSEAGISHVNVEIISDMSLTKGQCMIETDSGIYDCGLDTQLKELERKLKLFSYDK